MIQVKEGPGETHFQTEQHHHKFKNFKYILLTMNPFDKIMFQEALMPLT